MKIMETTTQVPQKKGGFQKWAMIVAIVIVLNLFFNYAISLVYKMPEYQDYMPQNQVVEPITNKDDCLKVGGQWTDPDPRYAEPNPTYPKAAPAVGYCDPNFTKSQEFQTAQKAYERNVFVVLVVLGVITLALGAMIANALLAVAFSWGGVLSLVIASMRYWSNAGNLLKVVILGVALGALIWVSVRKFSK
jgi:hypothetical protein